MSWMELCSAPGPFRDWVKVLVMWLVEGGFSETTVPRARVLGTSTTAATQTDGGSAQGHPGHMQGAGCPAGPLGG